MEGKIIPILQERSFEIAEGELYVLRDEENIPLNKEKRNSLFAFVAFLILMLVFGSYVFTSVPTIKSSRGANAAYYFPADPTTFIKVGSQLNASLGLELTLELNTTYLYPGGWLAASVFANNARNSVNNISSSNEWALTPQPSTQCFAIPALAISVFSGYYTESNVSNAASTNRVNYASPQIHSCEADLVGPSFSFLPLSDLVNSTKIPFENVVKFNGSWTTRGGQVVQDPLTPGIYTVVGMDEWKQMVILHFAVTNVEIVSATGPVPPFTPAGPTVRITLANLAEVPIIALYATLRVESQLSLAENYQFVFPVNQSLPLLTSKEVSSTMILVGAGIGNNQSYHLIISGTFEGGGNFTFIDLVTINLPP